MSGPIIRKYGFPNFDQIFGKKELQHGAEADDPDARSAAEQLAKAAGSADADGGAPASAQNTSALSKPGRVAGGG
jgi:hypothetical protein